MIQSAIRRFGIPQAEAGRIPDPLIRWGIRRFLAAGLAQRQAGSVEAQQAAKRHFIAAMAEAPIALQPDRANEQHYELPAPFFETVLGPRLKYSAGYWPTGTEDLAAAEDAMLERTAARAELADGQDILELGCGWGSLSLWMAARYPAAQITAVSNSADQRAFIEGRRDAQGLTNLEVVTADMNTFQAPATYDRIVSVEMFEHMRNWDRLLERIHGWLRPAGRLFLHIFIHRALAYPYELGETDWMTRYFFAGGLMPSQDLLCYQGRHFYLVDHWPVDGTHYQKTLEAWRRTLDAQRAAVMPVLEATYGADEANRWFHRWRLFFLACAELFGYRGGREWLVGHYLLAPH